MQIKRTLIAVLTAASVALAGCATGSSDQPRTVQQKIAACVGMALVGGLIGAAIANNTGNGNADRGVAPGVVAGLGVCAVWLAFENRRDRERIAQMHNAAAMTGQPQSQSWIGPDGRQRQVNVTPSTTTEMIVPQNGVQERRICRQLNTTASVDKSSDNMAEWTCRGPDGNWSSAPDALPVPAV